MMLDTTKVEAQWYRTYDQALAAFKRCDCKSAEDKFQASKTEAAAANRRPGRLVVVRKYYVRPLI